MSSIPAPGSCLVLVKWWLLATSHYLLVGLFTTGLVVAVIDDYQGRGLRTMLLSKLAD